MMKFLILVLALFATVYSEETVESGYVEDPNQIPPGYILQPDGSYLMTVTEQGDTVVHENVVNQDEYDIDDYSPPFSNNIITFGDGDDKSSFKISRNADAGDNENDYSVGPVQSSDDPTPLTSDDKDAPKVYTEGTQGQPGYENTLGVGKGPNRLYLKMRPDSSKPSGFRYIPQYISGYSKTPGRVEPNAEEPEDEGDNDLPDSPEVVKKKNYSVITIGRPGCRRYVKLTPSQTSNPYEFDLKPIKHPDQPDSTPDADDDEAPEVFPQGKRGTPDYQPIIASGPSVNRRYVRVVVDKNNPKRFNFQHAEPEGDPAEVATEPNEDDVEFEDVPPNTKYITKTIPGSKYPHEFVSVGQPGNRGHFKIVRKSNKPGDVEVTPVLDPDHPSSLPRPNDEFAPEVVQQGDPSDPNNCPIVATGPKFKRVYHKLLIIKKRVKWVPVLRKRVRGRYMYTLKKRIYHPIRRVRKVIIRKHPTRWVTKTVVRHQPSGGFFFGFLGGHKKVANGVRRIVLRRPGGEVTGQRIITTKEKWVDRGFHPTRPKVVETKKGGGFFFGMFGK